jgi:hypothetical protein
VLESGYLNITRSQLVIVDSRKSTAVLKATGIYRPSDCDNDVMNRSTSCKADRATAVIKNITPRNEDIKLGHDEIDKMHRFRFVVSHVGSISSFYLTS